MLLWHPVFNLMLDAFQVIEMRLRLIAAGKSTSAEMFLMVNEKIEALAQARTILIRGGNSGQVIDNYRKIVAANVQRLSAH
jgi:ABC-type taurine transport system ATPase subunit